MPGPAHMRISSRLIGLCLSLVLCGAFANPPPHGYAWVDVSLNLQPKGAHLAAFASRAGQPWLQVSILEDWGLIDQSSHVMLDIEGVAYSALHSIRGLRVRYDAELMQLALHIDPARLPRHNLAVTRPSGATRALERGLGWHLNYDALVTGVDDANTTSAAVFIEPVFYASMGSLRSGLRWLSEVSPQQASLLRLDTRWTTDLTSKVAQINLGDLISASDGFGGRSRIGGVQIKRDFSITPESLSFATPTLEGVAELPSNVELFINGTRRARLQTQPGPFSIDNTPIMSGAGQAELVLTNVLGEQVTQTVPYYVDPGLLRRGLLDYDLALGWQRQNYALRSFDYGEPIGVALLRYGVNDQATIEWRSRLSKAHSNGELRYQFQFLDWPMTLTTGMGLYLLDSGAKGPSGRLGLQWRHARYFAGLQALALRAPPTPEPALPLTRQILTRAGVHLRDWVLSYDALYRRKNAADRFERHGLRASRNLKLRAGHLGFTAASFLNRDSQTGRDAGLTLSLSWSPDQHHRWSISDRQAKVHQRLSSYQYRSGEELGRQWQVQNIRSGGRDRWLGQLDSRHSAAQARARWQYDGARTGLQLGLQGAIGRMQNHWFFSRALGSSYALLDLNGHPGVPVYRHNRVATHSNRHGLAVIPNLLPYQDNSIRIDTLDLPLQSQLRAEQLRIRPGAHSGIYREIAVQRSRAVQLRLMRQPLQPVPPGTVIYADDQAGRFFVGSDGETYLELEQDTVEFQAYWPDQQCGFSLSLEQIPAEILPHIGNVACR